MGSAAVRSAATAASAMTGDFKRDSTSVQANVELHTRSGRDDVLATVFTCDCNAEPFSEAYNVTTSAFHDAWAVSSGSADGGFTFDVAHPHQRIDYVFVLRNDTRAMHERGSSALRSAYARGLHEEALAEVSWLATPTVAIESERQVLRAMVFDLENSGVAHYDHGASDGVTIVSAEPLYGVKDSDHVPVFVRMQI